MVVQLQKKDYELVEDEIQEMHTAKEQIYGNIFREHPFKTNLKANEILDEILNKKNFAKFMDLQ